MFIVIVAGVYSDFSAQAFAFGPFATRGPADARLRIARNSNWTRYAEVVTRERAAEIFLAVDTMPCVRQAAARAIVAFRTKAFLDLARAEAEG